MIGVLERNVCVVELLLGNVLGRVLKVCIHWRHFDLVRMMLHRMMHHA